MGPALPAAPPHRLLRARLPLRQGTSTLSVITNEEGGIVDDTVMTNAGDWVYMVINGATKHDDIAHLRREMDAFGGDVQLEHLEDRSLLALQGPAAMDVLGTLCAAPLPEMAFMTSTPAAVAGVDGCIVTRCGYTGEDGFEVSVPSAHAERVARALLDHDAVLPAGLAARDSLRLEAGLCLYGTDLDPSVSPVEAGLRFTISAAHESPFPSPHAHTCPPPLTPYPPPAGKRRREEGGFNGAGRILREVRQPTPPRPPTALTAPFYPPSPPPSLPSLSMAPDLGRSGSSRKA